MKPVQLFDDEMLVSQSKGGIITLTNRRLRKTEDLSVETVLLQNIASIQVKSTNYFVFLILAILSAIGAVIAIIGQENEPFMVAALFAIIFTAVYFTTRKSYVSICPAGGDRINFTTQGMKHDEVVMFIDKVEKEMLKAHELREAQTFTRKEEKPINNAN